MFSLSTSFANLNDTPLPFSGNTKRRVLLKTLTNLSPIGLEHLAMMSGNALKEAANRFAEITKAKIVERQNGVPTFSDNILLALVEQLNRLDKNLTWEEGIKSLEPAAAAQMGEALLHLQFFLTWRSPERFVNYHERFLPTPSGLSSKAAVSSQELIMSQGVTECMQWKGLPIFKTVFDFSIYTMMLWDVKPGTIIELGSGTGSSAIWMADLMKTFGLEGRVYSVDLKKQNVKHEGVEFIQGNCWAVERIFTDEFLRSTPHPWLFVEDAHVNVYGVLSHFHSYFQKGDYVVIEDSLAKQDVISKFTKEHQGNYKLDTYYTDFFGRNATCSHDSIFVRT